MNSIKYNKLCNVMFPIFLIYIVPVSWIYILPTNFIVDSLVVLIALTVLKNKDKKSNYIKSIFKIWGLGFLSDIIGAIFLGVFFFAVEEYEPLREYANIAVVNPFESIISFFIVAICVFVAAFFIYYFNKKYSFNKCSLTEQEKNKISLWLAIFTAPYTFFIPLPILYHYLEML